MNGFEKLGDFLVDASRCDADAERSRTAKPGETRWNLDDFLRINSPTTNYPGFDSESERSPILLTIPRQRRMPLEWPSSRRRSNEPPAVNYLRRFVERQWRHDDPGTLAQTFHESARNGQYVERRLVLGGAPRAFLKIEEKDVATGRKVLVVPADKGDARIFIYTTSDGTGAVDFGASYDAAWDKVVALVEVFAKNAPRPPLQIVGGRNILETLVDSGGELELSPSAVRGLESLRWSQANVRPPIAVGAISRTLSSGQARSLCEERWSIWLTDTNVRANIFQIGNLPADFANFSFNEIVQPAETGISAVVPDANQDSPEKKALGNPPAASDWILHSAGRFYALEQNLSPGDVLSITDRISYEDAWKDGKVAGLRPLAVTNSASKLAIPTSYFEEVDLRPQVILDEFWRWSAQQEVEVAKTELAKKVVDSIKAKDPATTSGDDIERAADLHRSLRSGSFEARVALETLRERAARLGYYLATGFNDESIEKLDAAGNKVTIKLEVGTLYQRFNRTGSYNEKVITPWCYAHGHLHGHHHHGHYHSYCCRHFERTVTHNYEYVNYEPIPLTYEPWVGKRDQLTLAGFRCIMAELRTDGYYADDGSPLREIMQRAAADEAFRERLAIFLPIFQSRLNEGQVLVKYLIVVRPAPGFSPSLTPSLFCEEDLSYRAEWSGIELGELLHSVSLAPGEERTVTISRSISQRTERVDSITTVLDVTQSQKLDLSSSLQTTLQNERTSKSTSNWNANVSGSYGGFISGGAGAGGSSEKTSRDFSETVRKSAMQATREMRINNKQEIKSSTTIDTKVDVAESTTSKFSNINQGRSLNLMFYQVNNVYRAGLFLDDVHFLFARSTPLIEGTDIADPARYRFPELRKMLDAIADDPAFTAGDLYDEDDVRRLYLRKALQTILEEYVEFPVQDDDQADAEEVLTGQVLTALKWVSSNLAKSSGALVAGSGIDREDMGAAMAFLGRLTGKGAEDEKWEPVLLDDEITAGIRLLRKLSYRNAPIDTHVLLTPSGATYLDSIVGARPSTEDYSEKMRRLELRQKDAEIRRIMETGHRLDK